MNSKRMYFVLLAAIVVLFIGLFAGTYAVNSLLQQHSKRLVDLKTQSAVLANEQTSLLKAKKQVQQYSPLAAIAKTVVPQDKDQAEAVRQIASIASASGISQLSSVTFPASTLGGANGGAVSAAGSSSTTPAAPVVPKANSSLTQLQPVKGISGVYQLQITITQTTDNRVTYNQFLTFLTKLEQNRRTAQVASILLTPDTSNPNKVAFTLVLNEFIKP